MYEACAVGPQIIFGFLVFWFLVFGFLIVSYPSLSSAVVALVAPRFRYDSHEVSQ